ncbi:MAG: anaerobic ribonucleoside-triphosphate reductase activating protein [Mobilitalea sp.]
MQIHGFNKLTLLDYPGHLAATIFLGGCNMRCPFCHNASLVTSVASQPTIPVDEVFSTLVKRKNILEGVCITGGEPTLYPDLPDFIADVKALGFKVKLDTNGTNPSMMKALVKDGLIDYVAMDIKNAKGKYYLTSGVTNLNMELINESISFLLTAPIDYEFRTTIVKEHHTEQDILSIGQWITGAKAYYLQSYKDSGDILSPGLSSHNKETLLSYITLLTPYAEHVFLRGID